MKKTHLAVFAIAFVGPVLGVLLILLLGSEDKVFESTLQQARQALAEQRFADAERLANQSLMDDPQGTLSFPLSIAALAAAEQQHPDDVLAYLKRYPVDYEIRPEALDDIAVASQRLMEQGYFSAADQAMRFVLDHFPERYQTLRAQGQLLSFCGRRWEASRPFAASVRGIPSDLHDLLIMGSAKIAPRDQQQLLALGLEHAPDDPLVQLAWGRYEQSRENLAQAKTYYSRALAAAPDLLEAQVRMGWVWLDTDPDGEFLRWHASLMRRADDHPQTWVLRGLWARDHGQQPAAIRCFWQALLRDPIDPLANAQLGQLLAAAGNEEQAEPFLTMAQRLLEIDELMGKVNRKRLAFQDAYDGLISVKVPLHRTDMDLLRQIVESLQATGRLWEAGTWARLAMDVDIRAEWPEKLLNEILQEVDYKNPIPASRNPNLKVDFSRLPQPQFPPPPRDSAVVPPVDPGALPPIAFVDSAADAGIAFTYFNSSDPATQGMRMFEWTGGGVGVIDYDLDGWPDLYFTQGCAWPADESRREHLDRLFHNRGDGQFADVTAAAGLGDWRFSQGCSVGDFDGDGFADLYVANIGENRLYRNNGDGTFTDVTEASGIRGSQWTVSCLIADLDGDGLPEIYDVNYVTGEGVFTTMCQHNGVSRACTPTQFLAEHDRLYHNAGDGRFVDVTEDVGIVARDGVGLGIVAADFENRGRLNLFVANDGFANFYFCQTPDSAAGRLRFANRALLSGLAFSRDGKAQACMGVATGDANADGRLDLFVTNFFEDYNTLYEQIQPGLFIDATMKAGLRATSYRWLGFGTQFLDGELDGRPDLVLTNGDIDDFSQTGNRPYRQPPQYLRNLGGGRFTELPAATLGPFFSTPQLGRGLARLDWNRDGREDFVISHLDTPAALLTNRTETIGHFLAVQLRGVRSNRDAIGTTVTLEFAGITAVQQLTAGDGYMASNQRQMIFGLGEQRRVDRLTIRWPSGELAQFTDLPADVSLVFVESEPQHYQLP